jgi:chromosome segregation ATPase
MILYDLSREEKQAIAADKRQRSELAAPLAEARARLARLDEQITAQDTILTELREQLRIAKPAERPALREEIGDVEQDLRELRTQRPELERKMEKLAQRVEMEVRNGILAAQRKLERAREVY